MRNRQQPISHPLATRQNRRAALQRLAAAMGGLLLARALVNGAASRPLGHDDDTDDYDDSGHGRGRGRGRGRGGGDDDRDHDDRDDDRQQAASQPANVPAGSTIVRIVSDDVGGFVPAELAIEPGDTVTFLNEHDDEHTATGSGFDTGIIFPGGMATVRLDDAGRFLYACQIHPEMTGVIAVGDRVAAQDPPTRDGTPAPAATPVATAPLPQEADQRGDVSIVDFSFDPARLEVAAGTTVTWRNTGAAPHTVTGDFADSGILQPGASFSWTFAEPGEAAYVCAFHPNMTGSVIVSAAP